jgi:AmmeMemoRadiSam system protein A
VDLRVLDRVSDYDTKAILEFNDAVLREGIPGLDCALCGASALATVMLTMKEMRVKRVKVLPYANSGDVSGERHRVVGYGAAAFYREEEAKKGEAGMTEEIALTVAEKKTLFRIARQSIEAALEKKSIPDFDIPDGNLTLQRGVFVTLMNQGRLRGCIGHFAPDLPLWQIVSQMAVAAATRDYRFAYDPVTFREMPEIDIKISVLSELIKIDSIDEIEIGTHGIWIVQGGRSGTYLPEVATEMGWDKIEFLEHCCAEKAGLSPDAWKEGADLYIYSSQILDEKDF